MRWSKLRKLVKDRFAPSLANRLDIHSAAYGNCSCGHCWITLDGEIVANFCTRAYFNKLVYDQPGNNPKTHNLLVAYGEKSRQDAYHSMFDFVHSMSLEQALVSDDHLVQCLAILDARLGKRKLRSLELESFKPLARTLLQLRRELEGITQAS